MVRRVSLPFFLLFVGACGGTTVVDGGTDASMSPDLSTPDSGVDSGAATQSELYGPCNADSDCPGAGAVCRRNVDGFPQGYCTVPCTDRTPCDDGLSYNHCLPDGMGHSFCEHRCLNGVDCGRDGYTCEGNYPPADGRCIPVCSTDEACGAGAICQPATRRCAATGTLPPTGAAVGEACVANTDCATGRCFMEVVRGAPTGWLHGYCVGNCVLPVGFNPTSFFSGADLPQANCGTGEICLPANNAMTGRGDLGTCLHGCRGMSDCRAGYQCVQMIGSSSFGVGFCQPMQCSMTATCPTGYVCDTTHGNICASM